MENAEVIWSLKAGGLAILPTETVYGLFADALNPQAIDRLYQVKNRPKHKALNLNVADIETIFDYSASPPAYTEKLLTAFLPGPLTLILAANQRVPREILAGGSTVGFRMPKNSVTQEIIRHFDVLVGPSANLSGEPAPVKFDQISVPILTAAAAKIQDDNESQEATTILDLTASKAKILRRGSILGSDIMAKIPEIGEIDDI